MPHLPIHFRFSVSVQVCDFRMVRPTLHYNPERSRDVDTEWTYLNLTASPIDARGEILQPLSVALRENNDRGTVGLENRVPAFTERLRTAVTAPGGSRATRKLPRFPSREQKVRLAGS
jgi:hypothetical protein